MNMRAFLFNLAIFGFFLFGSVAADAEVFKYTDDKGNVHYVSEASKVPAQYQEQVNAPANLPKLTKAKSLDLKPSANYQPAEYAARKGKKNVEVFVTSWCGYCRQLENFLRQNKVSYTAYDIEKNRTGRKKYKAMGLNGGVPITKIGDTIISGFNEAEIRSALGL